MSYEAMHQVRASGLTDRTQVDVLEALAFFQNPETGDCYPSTEKIARISRVNDRLVRKTLKALHEMGYVSSEQKTGQKRYFTLHLDRLPGSAPLQEGTGLQESTALKESTPLHKSTGEGCRKVQGTPVGKCSTPLYETTPEQVNEQVNEQVKVTRDIGAHASDHFRDVTKKVETPKKEKRPSKWILIDRPETVSPEAWKAYCQIRAVKRVPLTEKAWEGIEREAEKAGISLSEAVDICNRQGWAGFKNSWLQNAGRSQGASKPTDPQHGIGVCQPPKEPTRLLTPEEVEETRRQMIEEGLIF